MEDGSDRTGMWLSAGNFGKQPGATEELHGEGTKDAWGKHELEAGLVQDLKGQS